MSRRSYTSLYDNQLPPLSTFMFPNHEQLKLYEPLARVCAAFIQELFEPESAANRFFPRNAYLTLPFFIAYALSQSPLDSNTTFAALSLLYRYKARVSRRQTKLRDPSRLFIAAYLVAAKLLSDKTYPMRTWGTLAQNNYDVQELAKMEAEFCAALDWKLRLNPDVLDSFRRIIETFLSTTCFGTRVNDTPHLDVPSTPLSPATPELGWSPQSDSFMWSPSSPAILKDDWARVQDAIDDSKANIESPDIQIAELSNKRRSFFDMSPRSLRNGPGVAKPSMTKRLSNLFLRGFGGSPRHR